MKRRVFFIGIFLSAFLIGCAAARSLMKERIFPPPKNEVVFSPPPENAKPVEIPSMPIERRFTPQIFGLKDWSDDSWEYPKFNNKLVDVQTHGKFYRRNEVVAKSGETWLGLFIDDAGSFLKNSQVKIVRDKETGYSDDDVLIKFREQNEPLFIVKGLRNLKEGKVTTLFARKKIEAENSYDNSNTMFHGFVREFHLGGRTYVLRAKGALTKSGETVLALVLESENVSQIVEYTPYFDGDFIGDLLWVGDLDGDEKLDFYMNFNNFEKGFFRSSLYLSSKAKKGKLVEEVASFGTAGC